MSRPWRFQADRMVRIFVVLKNNISPNIAKLYFFCGRNFIEMLSFAP
jgi:hypothetical protein